MPSSEDRYPAAMASLSPLVRSKAIEIANAIVDEGEDDGKAIRVAVAKAKQRATRRGFSRQGETRRS